MAAVLNEEGFSLQATSRTTEGAQHPDRDAQFRYINDKVCEFTQAGEPVISVDTKRRKCSATARWPVASGTAPVSPCRSAHDFPEKKAVPYGIYDLAADAGWVSVGCDGDTAAFAVATLRRWWEAEGRGPLPKRDPAADHRGRRRGERLPGADLEEGARRLQLRGRPGGRGLPLPSGTSRWNKIEHRLFSRISTNWRGRPLASHVVVVNTIGATTTRTGLTVRADSTPAPTRPAPPFPTTSWTGPPGAARVARHLELQHPTRTA